MSRKTVTTFLRIKVGGHFVMSIVKCYESHYVGVLDNPQLSQSVWENLDLGLVYRPHCVRSVLTTSVKILPYRPPSRLIRANYFIVTYGALDWFQSYLSNRQQCVRIGDAVSKVLSLEFGVPQGSNLGPVLFTIYVNDLLSVPKRCLSASYVDDCKLYLSFSPAELTTSISALNEDLMRISQWCCKNSLLINPDKTKVLAVGVQ